MHHRSASGDAMQLVSIVNWLLKREMLRNIEILHLTYPQIFISSPHVRFIRVWQQEEEKEDQCSRVQNRKELEKRGKSCGKVQERGAGEQ